MTVDRNGGEDERKPLDNNIEMDDCDSFVISEIKLSFMNRKSKRRIISTPTAVL